MNEKAVNEIKENELEDVVGGSFIDSNSRIAFACRKCGDIFYIKPGDRKVICPSCNATYDIKG